MFVYRNEWLGFRLCFGLAFIRSVQYFAFSQERQNTVPGQNGTGQCGAFRALTGLRPWKVCEDIMNGNGDFCSTDGARKLKQKIEMYWKERGFDVNVDLVEAGFTPSMRSGRTDVRSNMVNGMPTRFMMGEAMSDYSTLSANSGPTQH
jgi:hypothetical protein